MRAIKHQYYHKGVDNQVRADFTIDMRRIDNKHISKWTDEEKQNAVAWLNRTKASIETFINYALESLGESATKITTTNGN